MDLTPGKPWEAKAVLTQALEEGKTVTLNSFGFDANMGGNMMLFKIGDSDMLAVSPFWLDDCNIEDGPMLDADDDDDDADDDDDDDDDDES